jgi:hypothetical protein
MKSTATRAEFGNPAAPGRLTCTYKDLMGMSEALPPLEGIETGHTPNTTPPHPWWTR